ncbi:ABC transporter permease [Actinobaculum sp. 313]|uniref:ABC transporter permease n=1 Tax=Actinobaculum sp. 313 TaxID=2495645 RepID=UPI000F736228|nr:ABC transporter permease [Actinobaculum sp. 313]
MRRRRSSRNNDANVPELAAPSPADVEGMWPLGALAGESDGVDGEISSDKRAAGKATADTELGGEVASDTRADGEATEVIARADRESEVGASEDRETEVIARAGREGETGAPAERETEVFVWQDREGEHREDETGARADRETEGGARVDRETEAGGEAGAKRRRPWGMRIRDQITDVVTELSSRLSRAVLMISAVAFSTGALLASVGISQNAAHQVEADIVASTTNLVVVTVRGSSLSVESGDDVGDTDTGTDDGDTGGMAGGEPAGGDGSAADSEQAGGSEAGSSPVGDSSSEQEDGSAATASDSNGTTSSSEAAASTVRKTFPDDTEKRLEAINTVEVAGRRLDVSSVAGEARVGRTAIGLEESTSIQVRGVTSGYLHAADIEFTGSQDWMLDGEQNVAFLGATAAETLGIPVTDDTRDISIQVNGADYSIIGFLPGEHVFSDSAVIPYQRGLEIAGRDNETQVLIKTALGREARYPQSLVLRFFRRRRRSSPCRRW